MNTNLSKQPSTLLFDDDTITNDVESAEVECQRLADENGAILFEISADPSGVGANPRIAVEARLSADAPWVEVSARKFEDFDNTNLKTLIHANHRIYPRMRAAFRDIGGDAALTGKVVTVSLLE